MALELREQIKKLLDQSENILIVFKKQANGDSVASALALKAFLKKMGKNAEIAADNFSTPETLKFLADNQNILGKIDTLRQFIISLDLKTTPLKDFSYNIENDELKIYLTPKSGAFKAADIKSEGGKFKHDLIIAVDTEDLASLGDLFSQNQDFFHQTTIINIDHKPENEQYGQVNLIDLNVTSVAELLFNFFTQINPSIWTSPEGAPSGPIAQYLLTGLFFKTQSFKSPKVTPTTLMIASQLMKLGADREEIVKNVYYTKSIETLKLWGKVLSRLKAENGTQIAWSYLEEKDFTELNLTPERLDNVIEELILTAPEAKIVSIFYQFNGKLNGMIYSNSHHNAQELAVNHQPSGSKRLAVFPLDGADLQQSAKEVIEEIKLKVK